MSGSDLFSVAGKVALVTGGSRGIGRMIARGLVARGARVYVSGRAGCEQTARELASEGECRAIVADLADEAGIAGVVHALRAAEPELHVLVHSAGAHHVAPLEEHDPEAWDAVWRINTRAAFRLVQELLPQLEAAARPEDPARVIAIGSGDGSRIPAMDVYAYGASKAGLHHLVRHLARRLGKRGITVNVIAPGAYPTDMLEDALEIYGAETIAKQVPLRRLGDATDVEGAAVYLASRAGAYVTGAILPVDGGLALI